MLNLSGEPKEKRVSRKKLIKLAIIGVTAAVVVLAVGCSGSSGTSKSDVTKMANDAAFNALNKPVGTGANADGNAALWKIQPGLGTVMIEYNTRMANAWYAAQAGNWDMASYQVKEMTEIQEVAETTRPGRATDLKAFENGELKRLTDAIAAKDPQGFVTAYNGAIAGCNVCHKKQTSADFPKGYSFIKIVPPTTAATLDIDWKGQ